MDPISRWEHEVATKMACGMSKAEATSQLVRERPDLHEEYVQAFNEERGPASPFTGGRL